ncbi:MAG: GNAT family N-acetyltransferase [Chloroflexi bacterium]|nr:MAG: GNAT family N-acetyltransferase [Chloroflexota bacterium]
MLDLEQAPGSLLRPPMELIRPGSQVELRMISEPGQLGEVQSVLKGVWGGTFEWIHARLGSHLAIPGYLYVTACFVEGQAASVGCVYFHSGSPFANLYGGETLPEYRGRGLYTALLAARAQEVLRRGCRYLTIDDGPMSAPIVVRHGFQLLTHAWDCDWEPEGG